MCKKTCLLLSLLIAGLMYAQAQQQNNDTGDAGWLSLGVRNTMSVFGDEGTGMGAGGQFRLRLTRAVNSDWYYDYISINIGDKVRSEYQHIGWSVLFYPLPEIHYPKLVQPYILAGHCFDYNRMTDLRMPNKKEERWGSAAQAGLGAHFNITDKFDVSLMAQYMMHFTESLHAEMEGEEVHIHREKENALQGHVLATISVNYKIFKLW